METIFSQKQYRKLASGLVLCSILSACSLPEPKTLPDIPEAREKNTQQFIENIPTPIEYVRVPSSSMKPKRLNQHIPAAIANLPIEVRFNPNKATVSDLVSVLSTFGVQVGFRFTEEGREDILDRRLPFLRFNGNFRSLLDALRGGLGIVSWYENGIVFLSDKERYSVSFPQNDDILSAVAEELESLGAENITTSLRGGKVVYTASPTAQDEYIGPFLNRLSRNHSMVTMQVAVVSLALNDTADVGFDWSAFELAFDGRQSTLNAGNNNGGGGGGNNPSPMPPGGGQNPGMPQIPVPGMGNQPQAPDPGRDWSLTSDALSFGQTSLGTVFGKYGALSVGGAINFLSSFGNTNVTQNVELRTLSGTEVALRSGQEIPYVKGVSVNSSNSLNNNGLIGSTETETAQTGLTINLIPFYDADAEIVTMEVDVELRSILQFVELSAGAQIGTLTQPLTQDQTLTDIVRIKSGDTVVIGGLQYDTEDFNSTEPAFLRDRLESNGMSLGSRSHDINRNALFIILRPSVTVFIPEEE